MKLLPVAGVLKSSKTYVIPAYKEFPNSSLHNLPRVIYRPFEDPTSIDPSEVEKLLSKNDLQPAWRYGMFPFDHYHSNTHEVLVPYRGEAELAFGHHSSPEAVKHSARPGDVYILPAGIAHRSMSQSSDFQMVGSYPVGSHDWDNCRGDGDKDALWESVKKLGGLAHRLKKDPIYGSQDTTPLSEFWK